MRNIAEIIIDDRNGKKLSQTERQIAVAYVQGKYDAVRELEIGNASNTNKVLDKIKPEILEYIDDLDIATEICNIFDKYKGESEE